MSKPKQPSTHTTAVYARILSAMGTEPRLRILRLLLSAHHQQGHQTAEDHLLQLTLWSRI